VGDVEEGGRRGGRSVLRMGEVYTKAWTDSIPPNTHIAFAPLVFPKGLLDKFEMPLKKRQIARAEMLPIWRWVRDWRARNIVVC
jgi:hypothetical protein